VFQSTMSTLYVEPSFPWCFDYTVVDWLDEDIGTKVGRQG